ncbi:unnamed protein product [Allacma fusca]|uniref:Uncharacterized protein n=1 Tax=Allacma fusca TaxID=39272 RepID=A0A8J2NRZ0_9HEXA|nr:unnamed protein product [Allacma fusca]
MSDPEPCHEDSAVPRASFHKEPSKIAIVRPLVRSLLEDPIQISEKNDLEAGEELMEHLKVEDMDERSSSPKIEITNYDDDLAKTLEAAENALDELEEKSDLSVASRSKMNF